MEGSFSLDGTTLLSMDITEERQGRRVCREEGFYAVAVPEKTFCGVWQVTANWVWKDKDLEPSEEMI